jgi:putative transposase
MVDEAEQYAWPSHKGYLSSAKKSDWLHKEFMLSMLKKDPRQREKRYRAFMGEDEDDTLLRILSLKKLPSILGDNQFVDRLKSRFLEQKRHIEVPESKRLAPDITLIKLAICEQQFPQDRWTGAFPVFYRWVSVVGEPRFFPWRTAVMG